MMGHSHLALGALAGAVTASAMGQPWAVVAASAVIGTSTAHGRLSPDVDQTTMWRRFGRLGGLGAHRTGLSHWWGLPVLAAYGIHQLPEGNRWVFYALLAGWVSHLLGDLVFGKLAVLPWGGPKVGLGLRTDGFIEDGSLYFAGRKRTVIPFGPTRVLIYAALAYVLWTTPGLPTITAPSLPAAMPFAAAADTSGGDYDRDRFGTPWADVDKNGCSTRDDVLTRDLTDRTYRDKCVVLTGVLERDLYTGKRIEWTKARASAIQIDHIVSLSDAWRSGADRWTDAERKAFANDRFNLVAVDGPTNSRKSDQGPDTWLPADKAAACRYVGRYLDVKAKYRLTIQPDQAEAIGHTIDACENGEAP